MCSTLVHLFVAYSIPHRLPVSSAGTTGTLEGVGLPVVNNTHTQTSADGLNAT